MRRGPPSRVFVAVKSIPTVAAALRAAGTEGKPFFFCGLLEILEKTFNPASRPHGAHAADEVMRHLQSYMNTRRRKVPCSSSSRVSTFLDTLKLLGSGSTIATQSSM